MDGGPTSEPVRTVACRPRQAPRGDVGDCSVSRLAQAFGLVDLGSATPAIAATRAASECGWLKRRRRSPRQLDAVAVKARGGPARRRLRFQRTSAPSPDRFRSRGRCVGSPARGRGPRPRRAALAARPRPQPLAVSRGVHARGHLSFLTWPNYGVQRSRLRAFAASRANRHSGVGFPPTRARGRAEASPRRGGLALLLVGA